jgi:hypothetical protein
MNTRRHGSLTAIVAACALSAVACERGEADAGARPQAHASQAERPTDAAPRADAAHPTMHLTGCIERGVIPGSFMLTQVDVAGTDRAASTIPGGSPGTSGQADDRKLAGNRTDADITTTPTYTLRSLERGTDLGKYIGKRVTVTGRLTADRDQTGLGTRGTTSGEQAGAAGDDKLRSERPGATAAAGATPAAANVRQLDAESIRVVAGTCTPAQERR